jgi:hypothetical protein
LLEADLEPPPPDFDLAAPVPPAAFTVALTAPLTAPLTASVAASVKTSPITSCAVATTLLAPLAALFLLLVEEDLLPVDFLAAGFAADLLLAAALAVPPLDAAAFFAGVEDLAAPVVFFAPEADEVADLDDELDLAAVVDFPADFLAPPALAAVLDFAAVDLPFDFAAVAFPSAFCAGAFAAVFDEVEAAAFFSPALPVDLVVAITFSFCFRNKNNSERI